MGNDGRGKGRVKRKKENDLFPFHPIPSLFLFILLFNMNCFTVCLYCIQLKTGQFDFLFALQCKLIQTCTFVIFSVLLLIYHMGNHMCM